MLKHLFIFTVVPPKGCSYRFVKNSQESTCTKAFFKRLQASSLHLYLKANCDTVVFMRVLSIFWKVSDVKSILSKTAISCIYRTLINVIPHSCFGRNLMRLVENSYLKSTMKTLELSPRMLFIHGCLHCWLQTGIFLLLKI